MNKERRWKHEKMEWFGFVIFMIGTAFIVVGIIEYGFGTESAVQNIKYGAFLYVADVVVALIDDIV